MRVENIIGLAMNFMSVDWDTFKDAEVKVQIHDNTAYLLFKLENGLYERVGIPCHHLEGIGKWERYHVRSNGNEHCIVQLMPLIKYAKLDDAQAEIIGGIFEDYNQRIAELEVKLRNAKEIVNELKEAIK